MIVQRRVTHNDINQNCCPRGHNGLKTTQARPGALGYIFYNEAVRQLILVNKQGAATLLDYWLILILIK